MCLPAKSITFFIIFLASHLSRLDSLSTRCVWGFFFLLEPDFLLHTILFCKFNFSSFLPLPFILLFLSQLSQRVLFSVPHIWSRPSLFQFAVSRDPRVSF